jgi:diaminohydroxyphosphoribosylaminopyrimidine deaminase/5-amino-6-(5-phosphoribosylamino)uracil reductase
MMVDTFYMQLALSEAWKYQGLTYPNPAVGAVVVCEGKLLSVSAHQKAGTSHAEVLALLETYETISNKVLPFDRFNATLAHDFLVKLPKDFFRQCTIYVTLEPCSHVGKTPSCAVLLKRLQLRKVVVATKDPIVTHSGGMRLLEESGSEVVYGVLEEEAKSLLEPFVVWQKRAFVLFKLAQTTNGRIGGGYLSCQDSLHHVHQLRGVCSRLLIGGNTVRVDRPTLDCRFSGERAPNVTIYSRRDNFDRTVPLFGIEGREVNIGDSLDFLETPSFVLVEGGEGMLSMLEKRVDWMLWYQTPTITTEPLSYNAKIKMDFLQSRKCGKDIMIWSRVSEC